MHGANIKKMLAYVYGLVLYSVEGGKEKCDKVVNVASVLMNSSCFTTQYSEPSQIYYSFCMYV
jgi:hypothetical protein